MSPVCPRCDAALFLLEFEQIEVDYCPQCRGLWLDADEMDVLLAGGGSEAERRLARLHQLPAVGRRGRRTLCPRCDRRLEAVELTKGLREPLTLDRCPAAHGVWFDAGELHRLLEGTSPAGRGLRLAEHLRAVLGAEAGPKGE